MASLIASPPPGRRTLSVREAAGLALGRRPASYGLSLEYALRRYRAIKRGALRLRSVTTDQLWRELVEKVDRRMEENPAEDDFAALNHILDYDAPSRYFLSPHYAEKAFYRTRHRRRIARSRQSPDPVCS